VSIPCFYSISSYFYMLKLMFQCLNKWILLKN
jgi:hypothetical protein